MHGQAGVGSSAGFGIIQRLYQQYHCLRFSLGIETRSRALRWTWPLRAALVGVGLCLAGNASADMIHAPHTPPTWFGSVGAAVAALQALYPTATNWVGPTPTTPPDSCIGGWTMCTPSAWTELGTMEGAQVGDFIYLYACNINYVWQDQVPAYITSSTEPYQMSGCVPLPRKPCCNHYKGDPGDTGTGNETQSETDYTGTGPFPLTFTRTYNSLIPDSSNLGANWRSNFGDFAVGGITVNTGLTPNLATVRRPDGQVTYFTLVNGNWTAADADETDILTQTANGWTYTQRDGTVETYDNATDDTGNLTGKLLSITNPAGLTQTLTYDPTTGNLSSASDPFGHVLKFAYDTSGHLSTLTDPNGYVTTYGYDANNNLSTVTYPDGKVKTYLYNEQAYTQNTYLPHTLTGIVDESGNRFASFYYDSFGHVVLNEHAQTTNSVGQQQVSFVYNNGAMTTTTDAVGTEEIWTFNTNLGVQNLVSKQTRNAAGTLVGTLTQSFDTNNNLLCHQDEAGHVTTYTYNATNQRISMTEGDTGDCNNYLADVMTSGATRTTSYAYLSPTLNLVTEIDRRPSVDAGQTFKTQLFYGNTTATLPSTCIRDPAHPLLPICIIQSGYTPSGSSVTRSIGLTYTASGQVATLTDPLGHVTTFTYYNCNTGGACGELQYVTNALGQVTGYPHYDAAGRVIQMTDPAGLSTYHSYDPRGRVSTLTRNPSTGGIDYRSYGYWPSGRLGTRYVSIGNLRLPNT